MTIQNDNDKDDQSDQSNANPYNLRFYIEEPSGNIYRAEALSSTLVGDVATDFFEERGWPTRDRGGRPQRAVVERVDRVDPNKTSRLAVGESLEGFVHDDDTIRILPESVAGGGILTGSEQEFYLNQIITTNEQYQALSKLYTSLNNEIASQKEYIFFLEQRFKEIEQRFDDFISKMGNATIAVNATKQVRIDKKAIPIAKLRTGLIYSYNESEIKGLCLDLDIDYEVIAGQDKSEKVIELISYCKRYDLIVKLFELCQAQRPNVDWEE